MPGRERRLVCRRQLNGMSSLVHLMERRITVEVILDIGEQGVEFVIDGLFLLFVDDRLLDLFF